MNEQTTSLHHQPNPESDKMKRFSPFAAVTIAWLSAIAFWGPASAQPTSPGTPPQLGLYTCTEPSGYPDMTSMFALLDGSIYATAEKARGRYNFDPKTNMITMNSGPLAGKSYQRIPGTHAFLMQHREIALSCPHSPRDPLRYPW